MPISLYRLASVWKNNPIAQARWRTFSVTFRKSHGRCFPPRPYRGPADTGQAPICPLGLPEMSCQGVGQKPPFPYYLVGLKDQPRSDMRTTTSTCCSIRIRTVHCTAVKQIYHSGQVERASWKPATPAAERIVTKVIAGYLLLR